MLTVMIRLPAELDRVIEAKLDAVPLGKKEGLLVAVIRTSR
jgi:hypothetical protein